MPEMTITSPFVDSNTCAMGIGQPYATVNLNSAGVDFIPQSGSKNLTSENNWEIRPPYHRVTILCFLFGFFQLQTFKKETKIRCRDRITKKGRKKWEEEEKERSIMHGWEDGGGGRGRGTFDIPEDCPFSQSVPCMEGNKKTTSHPCAPVLYRAVFMNVQFFWGFWS